MDESQQLPHQLEALSARLSVPALSQLSALKGELTGPLFEGVLAEEHLLGLFAWATAVSERCRISGPFSAEEGIGGIVSALPEVMYGCVL